MSANRFSIIQVQRMVDRIMVTDELGVEEKSRLIAEALYPEQSCPDQVRALIHTLVAKNHVCQESLGEARGSLEELKSLCEKLTEPPWHTAVVLSVLESEQEGTGNNQRILVAQGTAQRVVSLADSLRADSLQVGDEVFLNADGNALIGKPPDGFVPATGETMTFDRYTSDEHRLVVRYHDEEFVAVPAGQLREVKLAQGDLLRCDRSIGLAYERIERSEGRQYFLGEVPDVRLDQVGGQRQSVEALLTALQTVLVEPEVAELYGLDGRQSPLMVGPPGCGKTLMARVVCSEISRTTGKQCRFAVVKPAEWFDPFVGVTEQNIRNCFAALRRAAQESGMAVLFLDEIETVGRLRGSLVGHHSDRFLGALLAEMDGFAGRQNVAVIAATNRKDLCDPALLERFDTQIHVPRPNMTAARQIFEIHLLRSAPYLTNGKPEDQTREEMIDVAVSRLYAPNNNNDLCAIRFRDGKQRTVTARELMSGRRIEQICRAARRRAFVRHVRNDEHGLRLSDMEEAVATTLDHMRTTLTPHNAHAYLTDLPQDIDVVAVEPIVPRVSRVHRHLNTTH